MVAVRSLVCVIDWFALWLVLWFYFVDCHSLCVVRLFGRVSLSLFCFAMVNCGFVSNRFWRLFNGFDVRVCGVALWRYVLLRLTAINFHGCVLVAGACGAKAHDACSHLLPCGGVCSARLTPAKPRTRQALQRLPVLSLLPRLTVLSLLPRPQQLSRRVRVRVFSPECVVSP